LATLNRSPRNKLVLTCHDRLPLSSPRLRRAWRFLANWFCGSGFAAAGDVTRCSGSVSIAIADSAIAAVCAAVKPGGNNTVLPTAATNGVRRVGSIIATGNVLTANVTRRLA
jgi:streptogramin lyase